MAYRETVQNEELKGFLLDATFFYNIGASVGYGCPNKPNDVRLIQFFLNAQAPVLGMGPKLVVDGIFGGQTWRRLKNFQLADGYDGKGMASTVNGIQYRSPKHHNVYTIYYLNFYYKAYYDGFWNDPRLDPAFPAELRSHLFGPLPQQV